MSQAGSLRGSFLANLQPALVHSIRQRAVVHHHPRGDTIVSEAEGRWTGIVLSGVARVYLRTEAGRQITIRHPRRGDTIGIAALLGESTVSAQAVTDCAVMQLDADQVLSLARTHPALALAIAREVSAVLFDTQREIVIREQGSVRQRIARQLLTFAGEFDPDEALVVSISHEDLADSVGSAREVVTRHLDRFQAEGIVTLDRAQITLLDPAGLHEATKAGGSSAA
jgi:CRP-like cAMP-binding protein